MSDQAGAGEGPSTSSHAAASSPSVQRSNPHQALTPAPWVARFAALIAPEGRVLDLACGYGRHARYLAAKLGLDAQKLFDIASKSSGQCWSMTSYCPVPGPVPTSPANRGYAPGFTGAMMLKDLRLAQEAAHAAGAATPLGAAAQALYALYVEGGRGGDDFSGIIRMLAGK